METASIFTATDALWLLHERQSSFRGIQKVSLSIFRFGTHRKSEAIDPTQADLEAKSAIQSIMKQPTDQEERNEDKKKPEKENPARGIDPESKEPEMDTEKK